MAFLQNDNELNLGRCVICNKRSIFSTRHCGFRIAYHKHCSRECVCKDENVKRKMVNSLQNTCLKKYNDTTAARLESTKEHSRQTRIKNSGSLKESYRIGLEHNKGIPFNPITKEKTMIERYGVKYFSQTQQWKNHMSVFMKQHSEEIGKKVSNTKQSFSEEHKQELVQKCLESKKRNKSFNTSKIEESFAKYLKENNFNFIRQYNIDERYPFPCDFYLPDFDLFIEIQGHWSHGNHPFNKTNENDKKILEKWKSKCGLRENGDVNQYVNAVHVWEIRDPFKRKIAKDNNLNYLEIFSVKLDVVIDIFKRHFIS